MGSDGATPNTKKGGWWANIPHHDTSDLNENKSSKEWFRKTFTILVVFIVFGSLLYMAAKNPGREVLVSAKGYIAQPPTLAALSNGCEGITTVPNSPDGTNGWVKQRKKPAWPPFPPVNGNFYDKTFLFPDTPIPYNAKPASIPKLGEAIGLLYRGWIVVWYQKPKVKAKEIENITKAVKEDVQLKNARILISPWPYNDNNWDGNQPWAYTAWGSVQKCTYFSLRVLQQFRETNPIEKAPAPDLPLLQSGPKATQFNQDAFGNN